MLTALIAEVLIGTAISLVASTVSLSIESKTAVAQQMAANAEQQYWVQATDALKNQTDDSRYKTQMRTTQITL